MDAEDIFRKLSVGMKFDFRRFGNDAQKLQVIKSKKTVTPRVTRVKEETEEVIETVNEHSDQIEDSFISDDNHDSNVELTILGSIKASNEEDQFKKKKNRKLKKKMTKEKLAELRKEQLAHFRKVNRISVKGKDIPPPVESFQKLQEEFNLSPTVMQNLQASGYIEPTGIQMQAIPIMLKDRQILASAPTGSGKTAAFLVPIIHHLKRPRKLGFRAVIVSPTRELAKQTFRECIRLSEGTGLRCHIISNANQAVNKFGPQSSQKFDILVTTPNRLVYLIQQDPPALSLKNVEWLIVDESDKLFEVGRTGFRDQLAVIYQACDSENVKRAMFSATHTALVANWATENLHELISVTVGHRNTASCDVEQKLLFVGSEAGKMVALRDLIQKGLTPPVLIFVQSKERAKELFSELIYDGINVDVIHADRTQLQRDNVVRSFRTGQIWVLICTELMGRGIDFKGVNLVLNYDFPPSAISYIHRIGRTGRAGRQGKAITYFTEDDKVHLRSIANMLRESGCEVPDYMLGIQRVHKSLRKKLERRGPQRESISTVPAYARQRKKKFKEKIKQSKLKRKKSEDVKLNPAKRRKKSIPE